MVLYFWQEKPTKPIVSKKGTSQLNLLKAPSTVGSSSGISSTSNSSTCEGKGNTKGSKSAGTGRLSAAGLSRVNPKQVATVLPCSQGSNTDTPSTSGSSTPVISQREMPEAFNCDEGDVQ